MISFKKTSCYNHECTYYWRLYSRYTKKVQFGFRVLAGNLLDSERIQLPPATIIADPGSWTIGVDSIEPTVEFVSLKPINELPPVPTVDSLSRSQQRQQRAAEHQAKLKLMEERIQELNSDILEEIGKAMLTGAELNPYSFAFGQLYKATPTLDERAEIQQLQEAQAEYQRRVRAKQLLDQRLRNTAPSVPIGHPPTVIVP
jgi:hypothetical protein